jgi:8-oxo-dGTP pyrophosphatase MutT (NUDIX family)
VPELSLDKVAWIHLNGDGRLLTARNIGVTLFYLPGGRREPGESDADTLVREVAEELAVDVDPGSLEHVGTFEEPGPASTVRRMTCYTAAYAGTPVATSEIEELRWLTLAERHHVSTIDQLVLDALAASGLLRRS